jgi:hypothetical protein
MSPEVVSQFIVTNYLSLWLEKPVQTAASTAFNITDCKLLLGLGNGFAARRRFGQIISQPLANFLGRKFGILEMCATWGDKGRGGYQY